MSKDQKIIFMGTPEFSAVCLQRLVDDGRNVVLAVTQPDKPVGRKKVITPPPAKVKAQELGIEVYQPDSLRTDEAYEKIASYGCDLLITAAYGKMLPERMLRIPVYDPINVHASLLPRYRGSSPVHRAIMNGDEVTGVTIMKMDAGMDTGDMLVKKEIKIDPGIHTPELMAELADIGSELLIGMLDDYTAGRIEPVPQDDSLAVAAPPVQSSEGEFTWEQDGLSIHNRIRALSEWPGAYFISGGKKTKIYDSEYMEAFADGADAAPGTIVKAHKSDLIVRCGSGFLKINELQNEGGKRLRASDCAHNFRTGALIGS